MKASEHPKFVEANEASANVMAILGHAVRNLDAAPQAIAAVAAWGLAGAPMATVEDLAERKAICGGDATRERCANWLPTEPGSPVMHCAACKCLSAKLSMATTRCPIGKWGPVNNSLSSP